MRKAARTALVLTIAASAAVAVTTPASAAPQKVSFCGTPQDLHFADVSPQGESPGDMRILHYALVDEAGKKIGTATQVSTLVATKPTQDALARVTFRLPKGHLIVDAAPSFASDFLSPSAVPISTKEYGIVIGGSGAYSGAHGSMSLKIVDPKKPLGCWTASLK